MKWLGHIIVILILLNSVCAQSYFYAGTKLVAYKDEVENTEYIYQNQLGTDINTQNLPFGQTLESEGRFGFTGKEEDAHGLHYFGARYYDSTLGRWTSTDPVPSEPTYQYVQNRPLQSIDPTGMAGEDGATWNNIKALYREPEQQTQGSWEYVEGGNPGSKVIKASAGAFVVSFAEPTPIGEALSVGGMIIGGGIFLSALIFSQQESGYYTHTGSIAVPGEFANPFARSSDQTRAAPIPLTEPLTKEELPETVSLFHGSIANYGDILTNGLSPENLPSYVSPFRIVAADAIARDRVNMEIGGDIEHYNWKQDMRGRKPYTGTGIVRFDIPGDLFEHMLATGMIQYRPYDGFNSKYAGEGFLELKINDQRALGMINPFRRADTPPQ